MVSTPRQPMLNGPSAPPITTNKIASPGRYRGLGSPVGVIPADKGATYLDEESGQEWQKTSDDGFSSGWEPEGSSDSTILVEGTTTARSASDRFGEVVNVKDFGAIGNGIVDDTEAIQFAINLAYTGSRICYIPAGMYLVSDTLLVPEGVKIVGAGSGSGYAEVVYTADPSIALVRKSGATVLFLEAGADCPMFELDSTRATVRNTESSLYDGRGTVNKYYFNVEFADIALHGNARSQTRHDCDLIKAVDAWGITLNRVQLIFAAGFSAKFWNCNVVKVTDLIVNGDLQKSRGILMFDSADSVFTGASMAGGFVAPALWVATPTGWLNNFSDLHFGDTQNIETGGQITAVAANVMTLSQNPRIETGQPVVFWTHSFDAGSALPTGITRGQVYFAIKIDATHYGFSDSLPNALAGTKSAISDIGTTCWLKCGPSSGLYLSKAVKNVFTNCRWDNSRDGGVILEDAGSNVLTSCQITKPGGGTSLDRVGLWVRSGGGNLFDNLIFADCKNPIRVDSSAVNKFGIFSFLNCTNGTDAADQINVRWFGAVGDGVHDDTEPIQRTIDAARTSKTSVFFPPGRYIATSWGGDWVFLLGYCSYDTTTGLTSATNPVVPLQDSPNFNALTLCGPETAAKRLARVDLDPDQVFQKGAVIQFTGSMANKIGFKTGHWQSNIILKNLTIVGPGHTVRTSTAFQVDVATTHWKLENCDFQHWGIAVDVGPNYATFADRHADYGKLKEVTATYCDIGVRVNNVNAYLTHLIDCSISARIPISNTRSAVVSPVGTSPRILLTNTFIAPLTEYNGVLVQSTVTSVSGQDVTISATITKTIKTRNGSFVLSATESAGAIADVTTEMFVLIGKNCSPTGSARTPDRCVLNTISAINSGTRTLTLVGAVDATFIVGQTIYMFLPAIGLYGDHFKMVGGHIEATLAEDFGFGPMLAKLDSWKAENVFEGVTVNLFSAQTASSVDSEFNKWLPKFYHKDLYSFHSASLKVAGCTLNILENKWEVSGTAGVRLESNSHYCRPLIIDHTGVSATGVVLDGEGTFLKSRVPFAHSGGPLELRALVARMGRDRYEQIGGLLKRPITPVTTAPTTGTTGEIFLLSASPEALYRIGSTSGVDGYYDAATISGVTATIDIVADPFLVTVNDLTGLYRDRVVSIVGALTGPADMTVCIDEVEIDTAGNRRIWLKQPATRSITGEAVNAVSPTIENSLAVGRAAATSAQLSVLGGASGTDIFELNRTDGITQSLVLRLLASVSRFRDKTTSRDLMDLTSEVLAIAARFHSGISFIESSSLPTAASLTSDSGTNPKDRLGFQMYNDKLVFSYNNAGVVTYLSLPLDGSSTTWTHGTTPP